KIEKLFYEFIKIIFIQFQCVNILLGLKPKLCSTPACSDAAAFIGTSLNTTANPCEDFYQFACGGWQQKNSIPEWQSSIDVNDQILERQTFQMKRQLERINFVTRFGESENLPTSVKLAASIYQKCVQFGQNNDFAY